MNLEQTNSDGKISESDATELTQSINQLIAEFGRYLSQVRQFSSLTQIAYESDLSLLHTFAKPLAEINSFDLRHFCARLYSQKISSRSIARKLSSVRSFYRWLIQYQGFTNNPGLGVRAPKHKKRLPKALGVDSMQQILDHPLSPTALANSSTFPTDQTGKLADELIDDSIDDSMEDQDQDQDHVQALVDQAMFELLYSSGLRVSELVSIDCYRVTSYEGKSYESISWLDSDSSSVFVTGKGKKSRIVPVGSKAMSAIKKWQKVRIGWLKIANDPSERAALFISKRGRRITSAYVRLRLKKFALPHGVHVHPHMLRHSFASHVLQSSGDLRAVQELLGHESIASTQVYTALDIQHLTRIYQDFHPRAKNAVKATDRVPLSVKKTSLPTTETLTTSDSSPNIKIK